MWGIVVNVGARRDNSVGVYRRVASVVVLPDVLHVHRAAHARDLVDVLGVVEQVWVFPQELLVAFEVNGVNLSIFIFCKISQYAWNIKLEENISNSVPYTNSFT